jgi:DNA mismatch repair ATPase MutS
VVILIIIICMFFVCQGLILSKALKAQKDAEDESTRIAFGNLRSEVIALRNEALEKDKILLSLVERLKSSEAGLASLSKVKQKMEKFEKKKEADVKRIADLEYALSIQVGLHRSEVEGLEKKLDEITENFNVEQAKHELSDTERLRVQKNVEELHQAKEECYNVAMQCCNKLKSTFAKIGAFSTKQDFIHGDPDGVIRWIEGEAEDFDETLVIGEIFVPALALEELSLCLKKLAVSMRRL